MLWNFENALSLRDYKGKARIYKTKKQIAKKERKMLSEMDVLENHKTYGSITFEDFCIVLCKLARRLAKVGKNRR